MYFFSNEVDAGIVEKYVNHNVSRIYFWQRHPCHGTNSHLTHINKTVFTKTRLQGNTLPSGTIFA